MLAKPPSAASNARLDRPDLAAIRAAHDRIRPFIRRTPVLTCQTLDRLAGATLFFKCENFQRTGAFKFRGACNAVFSLEPADAERGVVTHSSGNHAAALALAGRLRGIRVRIVMPENSPAVKQDAVRGYGGDITLCRPTLEARESTTAAIIDQTGATLIHPYNDYRIIAGQATAALELLEDVPELDALLAPVGGGGLLSGTLLAAKALCPGLAVYAGEPALADDAYRSWQAGTIQPAVRTDTIADGLRTSLGYKTFPILRELVAGILLATEAQIVAAMRLVFERMKLVIEPSAAVPLAALLAAQAPFQGKKVGIIFSGGNVDVAHLPFSQP